MDVLQEQSESPRFYIKLETRHCPACKVSRAAPHSHAASTPARQACLNPTVCPLTHWTPMVMQLHRILVTIRMHYKMCVDSARRVSVCCFEKEYLFSGRAAPAPVMRRCPRAAGESHLDHAPLTPSLQARTHLDQASAVHIHHLNHDCCRLDSALLPDGLLAGLVPPRMRQLAALCSAGAGQTSVAAVGMALGHCA